MWKLVMIANILNLGIPNWPTERLLPLYSWGYEISSAISWYNPIIFSLIVSRRLRSHSQSNSQGIQSNILYWYIDPETGFCPQLPQGTFSKEIVIFACVTARHCTWALSPCSHGIQCFIEYSSQCCIEYYILLVLQSLYSVSQ